MEIIGFVFGIFGLLAYLEVPSLKKRIEDLERDMSKTQGTSYHVDRTALVQATRSYIGKKVNIDLKEDHEDVDIINYGNMKYGTITILDTDGEWVLIRVENKKKNVTKLIRMDSIKGISVLTD
ncbi:MAG: hypothetical protein E7187_00890 [Erysipelotrichaceae bacterium]|nr:hypothetical protein [Erysipelotrichaceae bacterium]MBR2702190.1 hypothetical protein [Erysipelotrichaceae bacterium]